MEARVLTPLQLATTCRHENTWGCGTQSPTSPTIGVERHTESVDKQVVPMIFPEDLHLAGSFTQTEAVQEQQELDAWKQPYGIASETISFIEWSNSKPKAAPTAMRDGRCSSLTSSSGLCEISVLAHSTMTTKLTEPILSVTKKQRQRAGR